MCNSTSVGCKVGGAEIQPSSLDHEPVWFRVGFQGLTIALPLAIMLDAC